MVFGYRTVRNPLHQFRDEVDRLLTGVLAGRHDGVLPAMFRGQPAINVWEQNDALKVEMELPGVKSEQLDISVAGGELSVKVSAPEESQEEVTYHRRERPIGAFSRIVRLPVEVNAERVEADLHDGVLTITLPKAESAKPRKINITSQPTKEEHKRSHSNGK
jgi:HSP20 family protein